MSNLEDIYGMKCRHCGEKFELTHANKRYCSYHCKILHCNELTKQNKINGIMNDVVNNMEVNIQ